MDSEGLCEGFLRQLPGASSRLARRYLLSNTQEVVIGRDPACEIVLSSQYTLVSRRHAAFRPSPQSASRQVRWLLYDLNSANGTYFNGQRLQGCQELQAGDRITLGKNGAEFVFEYQRSSVSSPSNPSQQPMHAVSLTQLFPIISTGRDLVRKAYLVPGALTVVFVVLMFATVGQPEVAYFNQVLVATYLSAAAYYFVYQLCGKHKPLWVLLCAALATILILLSPILPLFIFIFRHLLPGSFPATTDSLIFPKLLVSMFFGAGLMEELIKALPVLGAYFVGMRVYSPLREAIGVWEPLDGILLGTASAVGFTLSETLGEYVPEIVHHMNLQGESIAVSQWIGLQLLIPRVLGSVAGHMAYSGYLGYFIGLSVLKPRRRWQIMAVGYGTSAAMHALWNSIGAFSNLFLAVVGVLSYAFLAAAVLKARALSPTRKQNFATRFSERL